MCLIKTPKVKSTPQDAEQRKPEFLHNPLLDGLTIATGEKRGRNSLRVDLQSPRAGINPVSGVGTAGAAAGVGIGVRRAAGVGNGVPSAFTTGLLIPTLTGGSNRSLGSTATYSGSGGSGSNWYGGYSGKGGGRTFIP